ncbi:hypothetical protein M422DRAFT_46032 [Sphaerobolus stellatus SS14]|uniref:F-box domain-containing protein n=1 Tax=Sphaerobolus stellatus (strain SS14) TaxID=990650 RepID=A0A0C9W590_SPHS4|nr:hypothetical protein M422DRAFT_46032 [Sphaerobolus stellatus SS14]
MVTNLSHVSSRLVHPTQAEDTQQPCLFTRLVDDILLYIGMHFLSHDDIWALTLVCRRLSAMFTPLLYNNVQLLLKRTAGRPGAPVNNREAILLAQKALRSNLRRRPQLNSNIRSLEWYLDNKEIRDKLYDLLRPMHNLENLYLCTPYGSPIIPDHVDTSHSSRLLPRCRRITIEGIMSLEYAKLLIDPSHIEYIGIDFQPRWAYPILDWISSSPAAFTRLQGLQFHFPGGRALNGRTETELLETWCRTMLAFRTVLREVTIIARVNDSGTFGVSCIQPRQTKLANIILPEFTKNEWPKLRRLTLKGFQRKDSQTMEGLRAVIPQVIFDDKLDPSDYLWHNHFAYSPMLR